MADRGAGVHSPFTFDATRPDGDQNVARAERQHPAWLHRESQGGPVLPRGGDLPAPGRGLLGRDGAGGARLPAGQPGRDGRTPEPAPEPIRSTSTAGSTSRAPTKALRSASSPSSPPSRGPTTLATSSSVPRSRSTRKPPGSVRSPIRSPRWWKGSRCGPVISGSISTVRTSPSIPTNCDPFSVDSVLFGNEGAAVSRSSFFQAANCSTLGYGPSLKLKLSGGVDRRGHPAIHAVLRTKPGEANTQKVSVTLPKGELLDNSHIDTICTRVNFAADNCPAGIPDRLCHRDDAAARPAAQWRRLPEGLQPPASGHGPRSAGAGAHRSRRADRQRQGEASHHLHVRPRPPVGKVSLRLTGGKTGLLENSEGLCGDPRRPRVTMTAQNGIGNGNRLSSCRRPAARGRGGK